MTFLEDKSLIILQTINLSWSKSTWQLCSAIYKDYTTFLNQILGLALQ